MLGWTFPERKRWSRRSVSDRLPLRRTNDHNLLDVVLIDDRRSEFVATEPASLGQSLVASKLGAQTISSDSRTDLLFHRCIYHRTSCLAIFSFASAAYPPIHPLLLWGTFNFSYGRQPVLVFAHHFQVCAPRSRSLLDFVGWASGNGR